MSELKRVIILERQVTSMVHATEQLQDKFRDLDHRTTTVEHRVAEIGNDIVDLRQKMSIIKAPTLVAAIAQLQSKYRELLAEVNSLREGR